MKLAFSTLGCPRWTWERVLRTAKELGYDGIELRGIGSELRNDRLPEFSDAVLPETMREMKAAGIALCCMDTSCNFDMDEKAEAAIEEGRAAIVLAAKTDAKGIRVFGNNITDAREEDTLARIAAGIRELCAYAERYNVEVWLETHGDITTSARIGEIARQVAHPLFGVIWDVEHTPEEPAVFYENMKPLIRHIHMKDSYAGADGRRVLCGTGKGTLPLRKIAAMLEKDGFTGYLSLEWEKRWHAELAEPEEEFPEYVCFMRHN